MTTKNTDALRAALATFDPATATTPAKVALAEATLHAAIELLDQVATATGEEYARGYMEDHLRALRCWRPCFQKVAQPAADLAQVVPY